MNIILKSVALAILLILTMPTSLDAQNYGNEWINYEQQYFKIHVSSDGLYRVSYSELVSAGIPVSLIDSRGISVFHKGEEQYIYIHGQTSSGVLDPAGYIEFYGQRNRGHQDEAFFDNPTNRVNNDYSFYNDTSAYFLTWNYTTTNRRLTSVNQTDYESYISSAQDYCIKNIRHNYTSTFYWGSTQNRYTEGEGWFDNHVITETAAVTKTIQLSEIYSTSSNAIIEIAAVGIPANYPTSNVPHHLKLEFLGQTRIDETYTGYEFVRKTLNIPANQLVSSMSFKFTSNDITQPEVNDRNVVSYIDINYPHTWNFENTDYFEFILPKNLATTKDYIEIQSFNTGTITYLYDLINHERILVNNASGTLKALVNHTDTQRKMLICNQSGYKSVDRITKISSNNKFVDYFGEHQNANYLIVTHKSLWSGAQQYAAYRNSTFNVLLMDVNHLYDQYGYGINKHPAAIRNISRRFYDYADKPRFLFLIGKSINFRAVRNNLTNYANCLVPSAGNPSSDNLITAGIDGNVYNPVFGTGRLSVGNNQGILQYLDKIIAYESNPTEEWMKRVMHFGGGANSGEQNTFANYLNGYKSIIEDTLYGASVTTYLKNSSAPIQITQSDSVRHIINTGTSMMTFFGHAYGQGFDQNIDFPENYNNQDRYPFILANSCYVGDLHQTGFYSFGELWINIPNKGAIAFLATTYKVIATYLNIFSSEFYKQIAYKAYNIPLGLQIVNTDKNIEAFYGSNVNMEITCHEFTLNGDPGIVINAHEKPDLTISEELVSFIPEKITSVIDSFDVKIVVKNIGRAVQDTFLVSANRTYPNGNTEQIYATVFGCNYLDTIMLKLPVDRQNGPGINSLKIFVDAFYQIDELSETNNEVTINFLIRSGDLFPIYPYKYAIYPNSEVTLIASTGDPFLPLADYRFQVDTCDKFNSPFLRSGFVQSAGGLVNWQVPFSLTENRVYYWRICHNHANPDSLIWKESSFIYIEGEEGWSQAHYNQFKEDEFLFINYLPTTQKFEYIDIPKRLNCHNTGVVNLQTIYEIGWNIDGAIHNGLGAIGNCGMASSMMVAVINPQTVLGWPSDIQNFGHRNYPQCFSSSSPNFIFSFNTNAVSLDSLKSMIDFVPDGFYILTYSWGNGNFSNWTEDLFQTYEALGSTNIRNVNDGAPYILFSKKGTPSSAQERFGSSYTDVIDLENINLITEFTYGFITSVIVGPSNTWESFNWMQYAEENPSDDDTWVKIYGITPQGETELVIDEIGTDTYEILNLNDSIDYQQYPNVKLKFYSKDETNKTPAQLDKWQLRFIGVPETAIDPQSGYYFCCDTINEGDEFSFGVATKNISTYDMDSLVVKYWLQDADNITTNIDTKTLRPHPAGDIIIDTITYSSLGLSGLNSIWIEYNPINENTGTYYQTEQHHFNNIAVKYFYVQKDITNPILDVSFDGRYIMNGEIISAKPEILVKLKDENQYLALNDTSLFRVYVTDIKAGIERRIYFTQQLNPEETIEWIPASLPENSCKIIYKPVFNTDGMYRLRVQATDVSSNESGANDYVIDFEVITQSTITQLLNYPNPFSTSTRFVFELTGSEIPEELQIQIFTITGKLVKVIFIDELGPIHIGRNITEYAWDGKDMYGDQLANGVYFYQVKAKINGQDIDHRATAADKYFKKEIGKMYLMR
ncbi:MAG: C25 family cysteine peptidase [Bacteroidales bacterium]|nr:C25 family cysteine peptidase [Bacteroidales bacterium]MDY0141771.1 C25 family cysteine peptidase [Bacteroidales bacterium]